MRIFSFASVVVLGLGLSAFGYEYDVRQPSDDLKPVFHAADTVPGKWSLNVEDVLAKAKAAGRCAIVLNSGSWWCPHCEIFEEKVFKSSTWKNFVAEGGYYLGLLDFPYRLEVSEDQQWKSWRPELGKGWGFKCWMMSADYLNEIGLTQDEGLAFIMRQYEFQKKLGEGSVSDPVVIKNPLTGADFSYCKVGYPTVIVYGPDGSELGRHAFGSWLGKPNVTDAEAQEEAIQTILKIITGTCVICDDPTSGAPDVSSAQEYDGWLVNEETDDLVGTISVRTSRFNGKKHAVRVKVQLTVGGKRVNFPAVDAIVDGCIACGDELFIRDFSVEKGGYVASIGLGRRGLTGKFVGNGESYAIAGGHNVFKARDAESKALVKLMPEGVWSLVVKSAAGPVSDPSTGGYGALSLQMKRTGKARITGRLSDGTRASYSAQAVIGSNGMVCVPADIPLYGKKGGLGFIAWFKDGKLLSVENVTAWRAAGKRTFTCPVTIMHTMTKNVSEVEAEQELVIEQFGPTSTIGGLPLAVDPSYDAITIRSRKWKGTAATKFTATSSNATGLLTGKMTFQVITSIGRIRKISCNFFGAIMGGAGYGTVIIKNEGSFAVKITACSACDD